MVRRVSRSHVLLVFFVVFMLVSVATVYAVYQTPYKEVKTINLCTYSSTANYDYTATLEPSTIYQNRTSLKAGEGVLYTKLTKEINPTLAFSFNTSIPTTTCTVSYDVNQTFKTTGWQHQIAQTQKAITSQKQFQMSLPEISLTELEDIKTQIDAESDRITSQYYSVEITPTFTITADVQGGTIHQTFQPTLTINFERTTEGDVINIEDLQQSQTENLTGEEAIWRQDVLNQRYASYVLIVISLTGLVFTAYDYRKKQPRTESKSELEKFIQAHRDLIVEISENTQLGVPQLTIVTVTKLKELVKTAEILAKPILHTMKEQRHVFHVIDNNVKYLYKEKPQKALHLKGLTDIEALQTY